MGSGEVREWRRARRCHGMPLVTRMGMRWSTWGGGLSLFQPYAPDNDTGTLLPRRLVIVSQRTVPPSLSLGVIDPCYPDTSLPFQVGIIFVFDRITMPMAPAILDSTRPVYPPIDSSKLTQKSDG